MKLTTFAIIIAAISCPVFAQDILDRARDANAARELERQNRALKRIQDQMSEMRAESKNVTRVVADAKPASQ